ncbi:MAG TPA: Zn-dependent hydrolase [Stellaceae bacterium]|nr:Zn-dependent hydrolase [Stellaceae bacterium]
MGAGPEPRPDVELAASLFDRLARETADPPGVTRQAYGPAEETAHRMMAECGAALGLDIARDFAGNTYLTLPGLDRAAPRILVGSHLDSVPHGGNFDGAAGVVCGLSALAALRHAGVRPRRDVTVMAIRAEESCWFPASYIGSRMALGRLPGEMVDTLRRSDTGRSLALHMRDLGFDPDLVRRNRPYLTSDRLACYVEVHIEQGPVLDEQQLPVGIVEAITGGPRYREGRIIGAYDHAGAAPRRFRRDAVAALGELITGVNALWRQLEAEGHYSVFTFGIVGTDPAMHSFSRVPGEARFCLDTRGIRPETVAEIRTRLAGLIDGIAERHRVCFALGPDTGPQIAQMSPEIRRRLGEAARALGIPFRDMPSGAGHDAAAFTGAGVPTGMIFIRNAHGSHNAEEAMDIADFEKACAVLTRLIAEYE